MGGVSYLLCLHLVCAWFCLGFFAGLVAYYYLCMGVLSQVMLVGLGAGEMCVRALALGWEGGE